MPQIGEIRSASELGYNGRERYIWWPCHLCHYSRWTEMRDGRPRYLHCHSCANKLKAKGETTSPHYWLIKCGENVGHCYCGATKDFGALLAAEERKISKRSRSRRW